MASPPQPQRGPVSTPVARLAEPLKRFHKEAWHTPHGRLIREVIFGLNDGVISTIGFLAGVTASMGDVRTIALGGLAAAFAFFGCVPAELWWDNPKTVAIAVWRGRDRQLHPRYAALASHYTFLVKQRIKNCARIGNHRREIGGLATAQAACRFVEVVLRSGLGSVDAIAPLNYVQVQLQNATL